MTFLAKRLGIYLTSRSFRINPTLVFPHFTIFFLVDFKCTYNYHLSNYRLNGIKLYF